MPLSWHQVSWAAASIYNCCDEPKNVADNGNSKPRPEFLN